MKHNPARATLHRVKAARRHPGSIAVALRVEMQSHPSTRKGAGTSGTERRGRRRACCPWPSVNPTGRTRSSRAAEEEFITPLPFPIPAHPRRTRRLGTNQLFLPREFVKKACVNRPTPLRFYICYLFAILCVSLVSTSVSLGAERQTEVLEPIFGSIINLRVFYSNPYRRQCSAVRRCAAVPGRGTRRANRRAVLPYPPSPFHL